MHVIGRTWGAALEKKIRSTDMHKKVQESHISWTLGGIGEGAGMVQLIVNKRTDDMQLATIATD